MLNYLTRVVATPMNIIMTSLDDAGISILQPIPFVSVAWVEHGASVGQNSTFMGK